MTSVFKCWALVLSIAGFAMNGVATAQTIEQQEHRIIRDIEYANVGGLPLRLDLYLPEDVSPPVACVVFVHGGGWKGGSKNSAQKNASWMTDHGFAIASIEYRLTDVARWPAQIDDCYAAVRWVRTNASEHGIDPDKIGAWGTSAGAHLASIMGTRRNPNPESVSSRVQAVCDWFGPSQLLTMPPNNIGNGRTEEDIAKSNGAKLLGATVRDVPKLARDASAIDHVSPEDASFLIMHGDEDPGVPLEQSTQLHAKLIRCGVDSTLHVLDGAKHGGPEFQSEQSRAAVWRFFQRTLRPDWNQAAGPSGNFRIRDAQAPTQWSLVHDQNIRWRKELPETGQSTVVSWGDRLFFTTIKPVTRESNLAKDIVAWCCDANTGQTLWTNEILAEHPLRMSGCFSDSTGPPAVTDGKHVCFFNASGKIACFDFDGKPVWQRDLMPVGRSQPTIVDDRVVFIKQAYMPDDHGHFTHEHKDAPLEKWTQLHALDLATGEDVWTTTCGVNMGCVPLLQTRSDGQRVMIVGRGGGHSPPEKPEGISMIDVSNGKTLWTLPLDRFMSTMTYSVYGDDVLVFHADEHIWVNALTGKIRRRGSILDRVSVCTHDHLGWSTSTQSISAGKKSREIIQQSNVLCGQYHFFRSYTNPWIGRVNVVSGDVEYLQLPVQLRRTLESDRDEWLWDWKGMEPDLVKKLLGQSKKKQKQLPITQWAFAANDMKNSRGHVVVGDDRSRGNGWGHHASQVPTVIGENLYIPTMAGTVYVIRWNSATLDDAAIVAINDLGPVGQAWNRASLSYGRGRLFAHTIREVICVGD